MGAERWMRMRVPMLNSAWQNVYHVPFVQRSGNFDSFLCEARAQLREGYMVYMESSRFECEVPRANVKSRVCEMQSDNIHPHDRPPTHIPRSPLTNYLTHVLCVLFASCEPVFTWFCHCNCNGKNTPHSANRPLVFFSVAV